MQDIMYGEESDEEDNEMDIMALQQLEQAESNRYYVRHNFYPSSKHDLINEHLKIVKYYIDHDESDHESISESSLPWLHESEFLKLYRCKPAMFNKVVQLVKNHDVFQKAQEKGRCQAPVEHQLMVALNYVGSYGIASSGSNQRQILYCGKGTCQIFRDQVVKAIRSLKNQVIMWPNKDDRNEIQKSIFEISSLPNCVGIVDGTLFFFNSRPETIDAADYSGRKNGYSLSAMIVCDHQRLVCEYLIGWPGSTHDDRVLRNSKLAKNPDKYFCKNQYLLGDSAYENKPFLVAAYKKPNGSFLEPEEQLLNEHLGKAHVISERYS